MTIYDQMMAQYSIGSGADEHNATCEVMQKIALAGLYKGGFFHYAAFYGGTCLRMFHGLQRYSEDMDFSLLAEEDGFTLETFFPAIVSEFRVVGRTVEIRKKDKRNFGKVESAFLKDNMETYDLTFQTHKSAKVKIEVDKQPPLLFHTEQKLFMQPYSFMVRCMTLPCLFAGKLHALVFRRWKNRVKGRDWYDFEWYVRSGIKVDFRHLHERILQFNNEDMTREQFMAALKERIATTDIEMVKADVQPFVANRAELDIWSADYFLAVADMLLFE